MKYVYSNISRLALLLIVFIIKTNPAMAQTKPTVKFIDFDSNVSSDVYLYNVEARLFLTGSNALRHSCMLDSERQGK